MADVNQIMLIVADEIARENGYIQIEEKTITGKTDWFWGNRAACPEAQVKSRTYVRPAWEDEQETSRYRPCKIYIDMNWGKPRIHVTTNNAFCCLTYSQDGFTEAQAYGENGLDEAVSLKNKIDKLIRNKLIELTLYRIYGEPKISKPKELYRIQPTFTMSFRKHKNKIFIVNDDVYIYFFDLFSRPHTFPDSEDISLPLEALQRKYPDLRKKQRKEKFVYADTWATILDRNEGYVCFRGLMPAIKESGYLPQLQFSVMEEFAALCTRNPGFCQITLGDFYYADYYRFISDMIEYIKRNHIK